MFRPLCHTYFCKPNHQNIKYKLLFACTYGVSHQPSTLVNMASLLSKYFEMENFSIDKSMKEIGVTETKKKILNLVKSFDILVIHYGKPAFNESFFKELKKKNKDLIIVYMDGDAGLNFPYTYFLVGYFDFFVSIDCPRTSDVIAQLGCKTICLGNVVSERDFYPIKNIKKTIDVLFYGGLKGNRKDIINYLSDNKIKVHCVGKSFGKISSKELIRTINKSKICLALNQIGQNPRAIELEEGYIVNTSIKARVFEPLLCKTFVLSEHVDGKERFFLIDKEISTFKGKEELVKKIRFYIKNPNLREKITNAGYKKVIKYYRGNQQITKMIDAIIKITNEKKGYKEKYKFLENNYKLEEPNKVLKFRKSNRRYVNYRAQIVHSLIKKKKYLYALKDMSFFLKGFPFLYFKNFFRLFLYNKFSFIINILKNTRKK